MNREKIILDIPLKEGRVNTVRISLFYDLGGHNWFNGNWDARGLFISITPIQVGDRFIGTTLGNGYYFPVKTLKRFSQKALDSYEIDDRDHSIICNAVEKIIEDHNLKVDFEKLFTAENQKYIDNGFDTGDFGIDIGSDYVTVSHPQSHDLHWVEDEWVESVDAMFATLNAIGLAYTGENKILGIMVQK